VFNDDVTDNGYEQLKQLLKTYLFACSVSGTL